MVSGGLRVVYGLVEGDFLGLKLSLGCNGVFMAGLFLRKKKKLMRSFWVLLL